MEFTSQKRSLSLSKKDKIKRKENNKLKGKKLEHLLQAQESKSSEHSGLDSEEQVEEIQCFLLECKFSLLE